MRQPLRRPFALPSLRLPLYALIGAALLWIASGVEVPASLGVLTGRLQGFVTVFLGIFIEALPFLLAGVLVSAIIHLFVSEELVRSMTPRNPVLAALAGSLLGLAFPVCECGSIPTARRLITKGATVPAGIAFMLAAPVINPIVLISTAVAFGGWQMAFWRAGLTLLFAVIIGVLVGSASDPQQILVAPTSDHDHHDDHDHGHHDHDHHDHHDHQHEATISGTLQHATQEFFEMGRYLVLGGLLAATLQTLVPQQALLALGSGPIVSVLVMIVLAVVLSICSTVDAFVALSFVNTFSQGSILAFLVFGPMIDIKSTMMLTTVFRRRTVAVIVLLCFQLAFLMGVLVNRFW